jgi:hypothetical protein
MTGNDVMISGFVIGGTTNKVVAIVATGPSLGAYGVTNPMSNPTLRLIRQSDGAQLAFNDNWRDAPNQAALTWNGYAPPHDNESAILINLAPGAYTTILSDAGGLAGVGIVGVYEAAQPESPLINLSTRGPVGADNNVMISGIVIPPGGSKTVAIVATGPSLAAYGIANPLANPTLTLVRSSDQSVVATNDDWGTAANAAQLQASGFAPSDPLESAIMISLAPGAYTAILSGAGGGTGVAVLGVYAP